MGKSKTPPPTPAPAPTFTPVQQKETEPIQRRAASAEAQDRAATNKSAGLLDETQGAAPAEDPTKAGLMG